MNGVAVLAAQHPRVTERNAVGNLTYTLSLSGL